MAVNAAEIPPRSIDDPLKCAVSTPTNCRLLVTAVTTICRVTGSRILAPRPSPECSVKKSGGQCQHPAPGSSSLLHSALTSRPCRSAYLRSRSAKSHSMLLARRRDPSEADGPSGPCPASAGRCELEPLPCPDTSRDKARHGLIKNRRSERMRPPPPCN